MHVEFLEAAQAALLSIPTWPFCYSHFMRMPTQAWCHGVIKHSLFPRCWDRAPHSSTLDALPRSSYHYLARHLCTLEVVPLPAEGPGTTNVIIQDGFSVSPRHALPSQVPLRSQAHHQTQMHLYTCICLL